MALGFGFAGLALTETVGAVSRAAVVLRAVTPDQPHLDLSSDSAHTSAQAVGILAKKTTSGNRTYPGNAP